MDKSSKKAKLSLKACDAAAMPKVRDIERMQVTGFDIALAQVHLENALREHYASCGKITDVYVNPSKSVGFVYFVGEGSVEKALKLNGTDLGGWKVCAEPYPFDDNLSLFARVKGYPTSLGDTELKTVLRDLFSSCGDVKRVDIFKDKDLAVVRLRGLEAYEKVQLLNGSYIGTHKIVVCSSGPPRYTDHPRRLYVNGWTYPSDKYPY